MQAIFPEITNLSKLVGKTDYDFYPKEQAEKFRATSPTWRATAAMPYC